MEELLIEIEAFAAKVGCKPTTVVQKAGAGGGATWARWKAGGACSVRTAERVRQYILQNKDSAV